MSTLYEILGVLSDATPDEVRAAFRKLAKELHPDAGGDPERFREAAHAYEVLGDPEARAEYDRTGRAGQDKAQRVAEEMATSALVMAAEQSPHPAHDDIPEMARDTLNHNLAESLRAAVDARCAASRFRTAAARLTRRGVSNPAGDEMLRRAAGLERAADSHDETAASIKAALEVVSSYDYHTDGVWHHQAQVAFGSTVRPRTTTTSNERKQR